MYFSFPHFNNFFVTHGHIPAIFMFLDMMLTELSHSQSPNILKHIFKVWKPKQKLILYHGKVKETFFISFKKAKMLKFLGIKSCLTGKIRLQTDFFLEIWKAVYFSFDCVPQLIQKSLILLCLHKENIILLTDCVD